MAAVASAIVTAIAEATTITTTTVVAANRRAAAAATATTTFETRRTISIVVPVPTAAIDVQAILDDDRVFSLEKLAVSVGV